MVIAVGIDRWEKAYNLARSDEVALENCGIEEINPTYSPSVGRHYNYAFAMIESEPEDVIGVVEKLLES